MARDYFQRQNLSRGFKNINENDIVMISDLDEIPNLKSLDFNDINNKLSFSNKMFYYKLNLFTITLYGMGQEPAKKDLLSPQWLRNIKLKFRYGI